MKKSEGWFPEVESRKCRGSDEKETFHAEFKKKMDH